MSTVVIIGAGHAAGQVAASLRQDGHEGPIIMLGDEPFIPYQRPPLSKQYLSGEQAIDRVYLRPQKFYDDKHIDVRTGVTVDRIDRSAKTVHTTAGDTIGYDDLIIATGSRARTLNIAGSDLEGIHYLRTVTDVDAIRSEMAAGKKLVIVGAGYIGLECAASCVKLGLGVTVLEMAPRVMSRVVAPEMSAFYQAEHALRGVDLRLNTTVSAFEGGARVTAVVCSDGSRVPADLVIVGIGIVPNVELAAEAGIACDNGIAVDEYCRTSDPKVYAIGDCCSHPSPHYGRRIRLESVDNAFEQAKTAAANICGRQVRHDKIPWFWSDQYDHKLQIVGLSQDYDRVVLRGDPASRAFSCCYLRGNVLLALDAVNQPRDFMTARKVIAERTPLDLARLADATQSLKDLGAAV